MPDLPTSDRLLLVEDDKDQAEELIESVETVLAQN